MATMPMIGTRIPESWKLELEDLATKTGRKTSQVVYEAIAAYLQKDHAGTLGNQVKDLSLRVASVEDRLQALTTLALPK